MAVNAFVKWSLGANFNVALLGVSEMPKPGTKLSLDFASLLGAQLRPLCNRSPCSLPAFRHHTVSARMSLVSPHL
jgi:hypothetical protein